MGGEGCLLLLVEGVARIFGKGTDLVIAAGEPIEELDAGVEVSVRCSPDRRERRQVCGFQFHGRSWSIRLIG